MTTVARFWVLSVSTLYLFPSLSSYAQTWSAEQTALWDYVTQSWEDDVAKNGKWPAEYAHESYVGWGAKDPAPRNREESISWNRVQNEGGSTTIWYKVTPMSIVIEGDTAVVMYYADLLVEDKEKKRKRDATGLVEVFVREGQGWKFLSSTGFKPNFGDE